MVWSFCWSRDRPFLGTRGELGGGFGKALIDGDGRNANPNLFFDSSARERGHGCVRREGIVDYSWLSFETISSWKQKHVNLII